MNEPSPPDPESEKLLDRVNQTGFPLQIALAALVNRTSTASASDWRWMVKYEEHSWKNVDDDREGFIDLILQNHPGTVAFVLECKRTLDSSWLFLMPDRKEAK